MARYLAANPPPPVGIWPCNLKTVAVFRHSKDCWVFGPAGPVGLDIPSVKIIAKAMKIKLSHRRLCELSIMADSAIRAMRERRGE